MKFKELKKEVIKVLKSKAYIFTLLSSIIIALVVGFIHIGVLNTHTFTSLIPKSHSKDKKKDKVNKASDTSSDKDVITPTGDISLLDFGDPTVSGEHCHNETLGVKVECDDSVIGAIEESAQFEKIAYNGNGTPLNTYKEFTKSYGVDQEDFSDLSEAQQKLHLNDDWKPLDSDGNVDPKRAVVTLCYPELGAYHVDKYVNQDGSTDNPNSNVSEVYVSVIDPCVWDDKSSNNKSTVYSALTYKWIRKQTDSGGTQWFNETTDDSDSLKKINMSLFKAFIYNYQDRSYILGGKSSGWKFFHDAIEDYPVIY